MRAHLIASIAILGVVGVVGCGGFGIHGRSTNPDPMVEVWTDRTSLFDGETLLIRITVTNPHDYPVVRRFPDGCQFGYRIEWAGKIVARAPLICTMAPTRLEVLPGEPIVREFEWTWSRQEIPPGSYELSAGLGKLGGPGPPVEILLRSGSRPESSPSG